MRTQLLPAALLALAAHVGAVKITSPAKNDVVDLSAGVTVKWTTVSTDPSRAHLVLVNMAAGHTPYSKDLGEVDLSKGSLVVTEKNVPRDEGYQFNFQSVDSANTGILAQSEQFKVDTSNSNSGGASSSSSAAASSTATGKTTSGTATATGAASGSTTTPAPTTLATVSSSVGDTGSATAKQSASTTRSATTSTSTGGAAVGPAVQGGTFLALLAGLAAFIA